MLKAPPWGGLFAEGDGGGQDDDALAVVAEAWAVGEASGGLSASGEGVAVYAAPLWSPEEEGGLSARKPGRASLWRQLAASRLALLGLGLLAALVLLALVAPWLSPYDYATQQLAARNEGPSLAHWFGTDDFGRDVWTRVWWGVRISLLIGVCAALIDLVIGVVYGGVSAYLGGRVDDALQRLLEVIYAVPYLLVAILLIMAIGPGLPSIIAAYALTGWVPMARLVRGQLLSLKEREFVLAARALGASGARIVLRHLLPNALGVMIVQLTFAVPAAMFAEAFLSFIGLGLKPPLASLGNLLSEGSGYIRFHQHRLIAPAVVFSLLLVSFHLLGDGLRDALDPNRRK